MKISTSPLTDAARKELAAEGVTLKAALRKIDAAIVIADAEFQRLLPPCPESDNAPDTEWEAWDDACEAAKVQTNWNGLRSDREQAENALFNWTERCMKAAHPKEFHLVEIVYRKAEQGDMKCRTELRRASFDLNIMLKPCR